MQGSLVVVQFVAVKMSAYCTDAFENQMNVQAAIIQTMSRMAHKHVHVQITLRGCHKYNNYLKCGYHYSNTMAFTMNIACRKG